MNRSCVLLLANTLLWLNKPVYFLRQPYLLKIFSVSTSDETVWDFEFGIGICIFRPKYRGIGIGFGIEIGMKSV